MDILLFVLAAILIVLSVVGSVLPALPGPPCGYIGLLLLQCTEKVNYSISFMVVWAIVVLFVAILDYYVPIIMTKGFGGSSYAVRGSIVGMIVGVFFTPVGIILGTFLGAVIGEFCNSKNLISSIKSGLGVFIGTMLSTGIKLIVCVCFLIYYVSALF